MTLDRPHFTILFKSRDGTICSAERCGFDLTSRDHVVHDIITGELDDVQAVIAWNPVEHTCDDITEEVARECARLLNDNGVAHCARADLRDFIDAHAPGALPAHSFEPAGVGKAA